MIEVAMEILEALPIQLLILKRGLQGRQEVLLVMRTPARLAKLEALGGVKPRKRLLAAVPTENAFLLVRLLQRPAQ